MISFGQALPLLSSISIEDWLERRVRVPVARSLVNQFSLKPRAMMVVVVLTCMGVPDVY